MKECRSATLLRAGLIARNGDRLAEPLRPEDRAILGIDDGMLFPAPLFAAGLAGSTFDLGWELAGLYELPPWAAVIAVSQTNGRGQMRRDWHSPPGNLHVSFFLPPEMAKMETLASLAAGVLVCAALRDMGISVSLKWPNDILLADRDGTEGKFGGLLLEDRAGKILAGLGLNLRSAPGPEELRPGHAAPAKALSAHTGTIGAFWQALAGRMRGYYQRTMAGASLEEIRGLAEHALAWKGRRVHAEDGNASGMVSGIAPDGSLVLQTGSGAVLVSSGSIVPVS